MSTNLTPLEVIEVLGIQPLPNNPFISMKLFSLFKTTAKISADLILQKGQDSTKATAAECFSLDAAGANKFVDGLTGDICLISL